MSSVRTGCSAAQGFCGGCKQAQRTRTIAEAEVFGIDKAARRIHRDHWVAHPKQRLARRWIHQMWQPTFERGMAVRSHTVHVIPSHAQTPRPGYYADSLLHQT